MKGITVENHALTLVDNLRRPEPGEGEVLVRVVSTTLNPSDPDIASGLFDEFFNFGDRRVRTGFEFSGVVARDGAGFTEGDRVYGYIDFLGGADWAHQEYLATKADCIAPMPKGMSFDEAASIPLAAQTVLEGLRDVAELKPGERLLIIGAGGGLGIIAVQIGKLLQAKVTAVAGPGQAEFLSSLGAHATVNYRSTPVNTLTETFDVILDLSAQYRHADIAQLLATSGRFLPADPGKNKDDFAEGSASAAATRYLLVAKGRRADLEQVTAWIEAGQLSAHVDSAFALADFERALERLRTRGKRGRIVLRVADPTTL